MLHQKRNSPPLWNELTSSLRMRKKWKRLAS